MKTTPDAACGCLPLEGAMPVDRRSRIHGIPRMKPLELVP